MNPILSILALSAIGWCALAWIRVPYVPVMLILAIVVLQAFYGNFSGTSALGFTVYPLDAITFSALPAVILRPRHPIPAWTAYPLISILLLSTIGSHTFSAAQALNEARPFLYFAITFVAVAVLTTPTDRRRIIGGIVLAGLPLALGCIWFWATHGLQGSTSNARLIAPNALFAGAIRDGRPFPADSALLMLQGAFFAIGSQTFGHRLRRLSIIIGIATVLIVVAMQHRTLWFALLASLLFTLMTHHGSIASSQRRRILLIAPVAAVMLVVLGLTARNAVNVLQSSADSSFSRSGTFAWRVDSWKALLTADRSPLEWLIGTPFGAGYDRVIHVGQLSGEVSVNPHDFYVQSLIRLGLVGTIVIIAMYIRTIRSLRHSSNPMALPAAASLVAAACFYVAYPPSVEQGVVLGCAAALNYRARRGVNVDNRRLHDDSQPERDHVELASTPAQSSYGSL